jgi:aminoglycoside phosphotransferase (APT) family kinase protein
MSETGNVLPAHRLDEERLWTHLAAQLPGFAGPATLRQFQGGQSNPTYLITTPAQRYVLRKKPPGVLLPGAHLVEREYRILHALRGTRVPVAPALLLCEDVSVIGTAFYVMAFIEGRVCEEVALPRVPATQRRAYYESMIRALAALHNADWRALGLADFGKPDHYIERQVERLSRRPPGPDTDAIPLLDALGDWLRRNLPRDETTTIVHGDFRPGNIIFERDGPRIAAVLDWELATLGNPLCDLAFLCTMYHLPPGTRRFDGLDGLDLAALNIPTEPEMVMGYCRETGRATLPDWRFFLAFAFFRVAALCHSVYARSLAGTAADPEAVHFDAVARLLADTGLGIAHSDRPVYRG